MSRDLSGNAEPMTEQELHDWVSHEITCLTKAMELRVKEATAIATAFASGQIDGDQARNRTLRYQDRWGESPVPGVPFPDGLTNKEIMERLDAAIDPEIRDAVWWQSDDAKASSPWAGRLKRSQASATDRPKSND